MVHSIIAEYEIKSKVKKIGFRKKKMEAFLPMLLLERLLKDIGI